MGSLRSITIRVWSGADHNLTSVILAPRTVKGCKKEMDTPKKNREIIFRNLVFILG
jgi:hypothetical protein